MKNLDYLRPLFPLQFNFKGTFFFFNLNIKIWKCFFKSLKGKKKTVSVNSLMILFVHRERLCGKALTVNRGVIWLHNSPMTAAPFDWQVIKISSKCFWIYTLENMSVTTVVGWPDSYVLNLIKKKLSQMKTLHYSGVSIKVTIYPADRTFPNEPIEKRGF